MIDSRLLNLQLSIWREVCRHPDLQAAMEPIAGTVRGHLPLDVLLVQRVDVARSQLGTIAVSVSDSAPSPATTRALSSADELNWLLAWCRQGQVTHFRAHEDGPQRRILIPAEVEGEIIAGPLYDAGEGAALLLLNARPPKTYSAEHIDVVRVLLEPVAVALVNDGRLRGLEQSRQSADADRHSLLSKLGRKAIGEQVIGAEAGLRATMERVELVSRSDVPVLILGETGSGKEVIARAVHTRSPRSSGPFLRVNCGAMPPELIDSELFGHERGSFTGAVGLRKGWFERADGGTLFLDEVGELPLAAQVRLLRILQDGTFERVGGQQQLRVDVRVIAATNQDLHSMSANGRFRSDLWYRLSVFPIYLPALRERPEDMQELANHFAMRAARRFGLPPLIPSVDDIDLLLTYHWPGNIRELAAVIDRAALLGNGRHLEVKKALGVNEDTVGPWNSVRPPVAPRPRGRIASLDAVVRNHIEQALEATLGRVEGPRGAARLLEVNPHTLRSRMRKLRIDWRRFRAFDS